VFLLLLPLLLLRRRRLEGTSRQRCEGLVEVSPAAAAAAACASAGVRGRLRPQLRDVVSAL